MTITLPRPRVVAVPERVRDTLAAERVGALLVVGGTATMAASAAVLVSLALLPTGSSFLARTVSAAVYGPYGELVSVALLLFGLGALALGLALAARVHGRAGRVCGGLVSVWATASMIDAFLRTNRIGVHTVRGESHIVLAIIGLVAQLIVASYLPLLLRRRTGRASYATFGSSVLVVAAGGFFALHPADLAGLAERSLLASSALWMIVNVRVAARLEPRT